jgi:Trk-type K+ transport system membrane component
MGILPMSSFDLSASDLSPSKTEPAKTVQRGPNREAKVDPDATSGATGTLRDAVPPPRPDLLSWLIPAYLGLVLVGVVVFKFGPVMARGHEMSVARAVFTAVNAATLTGFPSTVGLEDFDEEGSLGPVAVLVLMAGGALFSLIGGGLAAVRVLRLPYSDGQVISAAVACLVLAILAGAAALLSHDRRMFDSVFQAASAFTNSGLYTGRLPGPATFRGQGVLLPLAFLGGLGLPVLMELFDRLTGTARSLSAHTHTVLGTSALIYLLATLTFALMLIPKAAPPTAGGEYAPHWRDAVATASAAAINARGAGFPFEVASAYPRAMQWLLILLMAVGSNTAGTGGGLKATTLAVLCRGVRSALRGERVPRAAGVAAAWLLTYAAIVFTGLLLLLWRAADVAADRLLFLTVSAASNVGLAHDPVSITGPGLYTLCTVMLAGRVAPLFILWWMANTTTDADVAVG